MKKKIGKLVFYAQSTSTVISGEEEEDKEEKEKEEKDEEEEGRWTPLPRALTTDQDEVDA